MSEAPEALNAKRRPDWAALLIGVALLVVGAVVAWDTASLRGGGYSQIGPKAFPYAIAAGFVLLSIWTVIESWRGDFPERSHDEVAPIVWIVGGLAAQLLLLDVAGFSIATGLLFAATAAAFGRRAFWKTIPFGILLSLLLWLLFTNVLNLSLPDGPFENRVDALLTFGG